jgi:hypothetical protein
MDILAHFLWTFAIYWRHPKRWIAGALGFMPDIISFGPHFVSSLMSGIDMGRPHDIPRYVYIMYDVSHSIVICILGMTLLWFFAREWFWLSFGWPLHIIIDLPTHTASFFPTPLFWPISGYQLSGISWGTGWFMLLNYSALAVVYAYLIKAPKKHLY